MKSFQILFRSLHFYTKYKGPDDGICLFHHSYIDLLDLELLLSPLSTAVVFIVLAAASVRQTFISDNNIFSINLESSFASFTCTLLHAFIIYGFFTLILCVSQEILYSNKMYFVFHMSTSLFPAVKKQKLWPYSFYQPSSDLCYFHQLCFSPSQPLYHT